MKNLMLFVVFCLIAMKGAALTIAAEDERPNVLFVAIDDLNDWVGCLGGNPQTKTPNLDKFARSRAMVMSRAYCPAAVCGPSRTALLTGLMPSTTGVYGNSQNLKNAPKAKDAVTLPQYFSRHGYHSLSSGKIFHRHATADGFDEGQWAFDDHHNAGGGMGRVDRIAPPPIEGIDPHGTDFAWGATDAAFEDTKDYRTCAWGAEQLQRGFDKPFFLAIGISKPHLPWFVPKEFFDTHPLDQVQPIEFRDDDLDDIIKTNGAPLFRPSARFVLTDRAGMHREAARAYLAATSYADACVGVLLDGLDKSKYRDNTIVIIWGDHGWHLSEKLHYGKTTLWEESARVPLLVSVPGVTQGGAQCDGVVNLIDLYPTLVELCRLPANEANEGRSFAPLFRNPTTEWNRPTLTTQGFRNHSLTDGRYRYIRHGGRGEGAEELYDHADDPKEWNNLANQPGYEAIKERLRGFLPEHDQPDSPANRAAGRDKPSTVRKGTFQRGENP
jgi:arylsulfatase A-like enzyme